MQIYNRELIEITKKSTYTFNIRVLDTQEQITLNVQSEELVLCKLDSKHKDTLIAIAEGPYNIFYIHVKSDVLYCTPYINGDSEGSIDIEIEYYSNRFFLKKELYDYKLVDCYTHEEVLLNSSLFKIGNKKLPFTKDRGMNEPYIYLKIKYFNYVSFLEYTKKGEEFYIKTSRYELYDNPSSLQIDFESANRFTLKNR